MSASALASIRFRHRDSQQPSLRHSGKLREVLLFQIVACLIISAFLDVDARSDDLVDDTAADSVRTSEEIGVAGYSQCVRQQ